MTDSIDLGDELRAVRRAVEALGLMHDAHDFSDRNAHAYAAAGVVSLIVERLRLIERVIRGTVDPALLVATHNTSLAGRDTPTYRGLTIAPWPRRST